LADLRPTLRREQAPIEEATSAHEEGHGRAQWSSSRASGDEAIVLESLWLQSGFRNLVSTVYIPDRAESFGWGQARSRSRQSCG